MTIQRVIKKAIKGGFDPFNHSKVWKKYGFEINIDNKGSDMILIWGIDEHRVTTYDHISKYEIFLINDFWQSLGKALGWNKYRCDICGRDQDHCNKEVYNSLKDKPNEKVVCISRLIPAWFYHWHRLIDHLAEGKTIESYFKTL